MIYMSVVGLNITVPVEIVAQFDQERRWVKRSAAITKVLEYLCRNPGTIRTIVGANNVPPEYQIDPKPN